MHSFLRSAAIVLFALVRAIPAAPVVIVSPGNAGDIVITKENTVNATVPAPTRNNTKTLMTTTNGRLPLALVNNLGGGAVNAYVTGLDAQNHLVRVPWR